MARGEKFSFVVDADIAGRMDRVIMINDGRILAKERKEGGTVYTIVRT
ncbi:hypothetical protein ACLG6S_11970 [Thermodesulfobacteriota bacterium B35]